MPASRNVQARPIPEALLTSAEVAVLFRVDPKTFTRWAKAGKLSSIRTLGGHRRYRETGVRRLLRGADAAEQPFGSCDGPPPGDQPSRVTPSTT